MIITAAICTHDRYDTLGDAIGSLCGQTLSRDAFQILVVDNSSDSEQAHEFATRYREVENLRFVYIDRPGLSQARNVAIQQCATQYLAYVDDDAVAESDWLASIARFFETASTEVAAVGGPVAPIWEVPRPSWLDDNLLGYVGVINLGDKEKEVGSASLIGTNVAYRREALVAAGGFRTDLGRRGQLLISNEEIELHDRLLAAGQRLVYCPDIRVQHRVAKHRLTQQWMRKRIFWQGISDLMSTSDAAPTALMPRRWGLSRETNNPRRFNRQCHRIVRVIRKLGLGWRVL
jgi:glucosyl-dolichyl phosphate glucuronosyltransferase